MLQALLAVALLAPAAQDQSQGPAPLFPPAEEALGITVGEGQAMSYLSLVAAYAQVTGQNVTFDEGTEARLRQRTVSLARSLVVQPAEVQRVFESLMISADFVIAPIGSGDLPIVRVDDLMGQGRANLRSQAITIEIDRLEVIRQHPAVMFSTTVELPHTDVRQVSNSMRTLITDANTQQLLPAGASNSMVIVGFGEQVAGLVDMLRAIDDAAGRHAQAQELQVEVIALSHGNAEDVARICGLVFNASTAPQQAQQAPPGAVPPRSLLIVPDGRTNSLVVRGTAAEQERVATLVGRLDREVK